MKLSSLQNINELNQIIIKGINLINSILSNKLLFIFNGKGGIDQIPS
jgi:hypothetical protein